MLKRIAGVFLIFAGMMFLIPENVLAEKGGDVIKLPRPDHKGEVSVEEAIFERRAVRNFTGEPLTLKEASQLLWAAGGETVDGVTGPTRAYPSAGAAYPLEIYLVAGEVTGLGSGVYRYNWRGNSLTLIRKGDYRSALARAALGQSMIKQAPATIVITALYERTTRRYGQRGRTLYVPIDTGHVGQNVHLQAQALGLGTVMVGAFRDKEVASVIKSEKDIPIYIMPVGRPRQ